MTCPTCGRPVVEGQRFCGNCGADVQAITSLRPVQRQTNPPPPPHGAADANYDYEDSGYDYMAATRRGLSAPLIWLIVVAVAVVCLCCGLVIGGTAVYWLFPVREIPAAPTPTPEALRLLFHV